MTAELSVTKMSVELKQRDADEWRNRCQTLRQENERLRREIDDSEGDRLDIVTQLKAEVDKKDAMILSQRKQLETGQVALSRLESQLKAAHANELRELEQRLSDQDAQVEALQTELAVVREFRKKRAAMQAELDEAKKTLLEEAQKHKEEISALEYKFYEEKVRFQKETTAKLNEMQATSQKEALQRLDDNSKQVLAENRRMAAELQLQVQETDVLQTTRKTLEEDNKRLLREVALNEGSVKEHAKQGHKLQKQVAMLSTRIAELTSDLERQRASAGEVVAEQARAAAKDKEALQFEVAGVRKLLALKTKEVRNFRKLAQAILLQRSELETFFLTSLETVKNEIETEAKNLVNGDFNPASTRPAPATGKVSIADLSWEERERVLKYLFVKLNGTTPSAGDDLVQTIGSGPSSSLGGAGLSTLPPLHEV